MSPEACWVRKNEDSWRRWYKRVRKLRGRKLHGYFGIVSEFAAL